MLSKSLIHFSFDGRGCVPSLLFGLRPTMVGVMRVMATSFRRTCAGTVVFSADCAAGRCRPTPPPQTPGHSQASLDQFLSPGSWCAQVLFVSSKSLFPQSCGSSIIKSHWPPKSNSLGVLSPFARTPGWTHNSVGPRTFLTA